MTRFKTWICGRFLLLFALCMVAAFIALVAAMTMSGSLQYLDFVALCLLAGVSAFGAIYFSTLWFLVFTTLKRISRLSNKRSLRLLGSVAGIAVSVLPFILADAVIVHEGEIWTLIRAGVLGGVIFGFIGASIFNRPKSAVREPPSSS